jgi:hypothetical protein
MLHVRVVCGVTLLMGFLACGNDGQSSVRNGELQDEGYNKASGGTDATPGAGGAGTGGSYPGDIDVDLPEEPDHPPVNGCAEDADCFVRMFMRDPCRDQYFNP